jgi:hypothetical protein
MKDYLLKFEIRTPEGVKTFYENVYDTPSTVRSKAEGVARHYNAEVQIFCFEGKVVCKPETSLVHYTPGPVIDDIAF